MDGETVETVTGWASEAFEGGYAGLHDLAAREFTGAVTDGTAWLFALSGRVVGVADGDVESFADADGTAYAAPDPSLPLLFAMREAGDGGETKGRYYTNDTPLSEVDETLSAGNFTGYVELSENVLSGDYYVVYHGGRSLACAFVGSSRRTLTGDEAFERANDEVGIYEVHEVPVSVVDVPDPEPESDSSGVGVAAAADDSEETQEVPADSDGTVDDDAERSADDATEDPSAGVAPGGVTIDPGTGADTDADDADDGAAEAGEVDDADPVADDAPTGDADGTADSDPVADATADPAPTEALDADPDAGSEPETGAERDSDRGDGEPTADPRDDDAPADAGPDRDPDAGGDGGPDDPDDRSASGPDDGTDSRAGDGRNRDGRRPYARRDGEPTDAVSGAESDPFSAEAEWRETRAIPPLDPADAGEGSAGERADAEAGTAAGAAGSASADDGPSGDDAAGADDAAATTGSAGTETADTADAPDADADSTARDEARERLAETEAELESARAEAEETGAEVRRLREENDRLRDRVEHLEAEVESVREEAAAARERAPDAPDAPAERAVHADRALAGTNLFVRYESKGGPTLEEALAGSATAAEVNDNLRVERHTDFDAGAVVVDGRPFDEFLDDTIEYGFVEWVVRDLLYEIRETHNQSSLRGLFTALPKVDRAELHGAVDLVDEEGKRDEERTFDVVLRDRMGTPLVVADVTDSREPTTETMLDELVGGANDVADREDGLCAAFSVTASFFEPGALEAAADATGGGLLGRGKHKSFVRLSRKRGFHLCLVEARDGEFHVSVPEL